MSSVVGARGDVTGGSIREEASRPGYRAKLGHGLRIAGWAALGFYVVWVVISPVLFPIWAFFFPEPGRQLFIPTPYGALRALTLEISPTAPAIPTEWVLAFFVNMFFFGLASAVLLRGRRLSAPRLVDLLDRDSRPPILYLRSFSSDRPPLSIKVLRALSGPIHKTEEERLVRAFQRAGPICAVGMPGEKIPELGAARIYLSDDVWQEWVRQFARKSQLVLLRVADSPGVWWELETIMREVPIERIVLCLSEEKRGIQLAISLLPFVAFLQGITPFQSRTYEKLSQFLFASRSCELPPYSKNAKVVYFSDAGEACLGGRSLTFLEALGQEPGIAIYYDEVFRPVLQRAGISYPKKWLPWTVKFAIVGLTTGLLMLVASFFVQRQLDYARVMAAKAQIIRIEQALEFYHLDNERFPSASQGLQALVTRPTALPEPGFYNPSGYIKAEALEDPWGHPFRFRIPGLRNPQTFDIWSLGRDGAAGGIGVDADIGNWDDSAQIEGLPSPSQIDKSEY